jgi:hypothetical protein
VRDFGGYLRLYRGYLLVFVLGVAIATGVLLALKPWSSTSGTSIAPAPGAPAKGAKFGALFHPPTSARLQALVKPFWLGAKLGPYPASLRHEAGNVERAVFAYTDAGDPDRPHVLVRVLDTAALSGGLPSAGSELVKQMARLKAFATPLGPAALVSANQALVRPAKDTVVEITILDDPGPVPSLRQLATRLVAAS